MKRKNLPFSHLLQQVEKTDIRSRETAKIGNWVLPKAGSNLSNFLASDALPFSHLLQQVEKTDIWSRRAAEMNSIKER